MGDFCLQNHRREPAPPYGQLQKLRAARACPLPQENLRRAYAGFSSPSSARPTVYALLASRGRRPARARSPAAQVERGRQAGGDREPGRGAATKDGRCPRVHTSPSPSPACLLGVNDHRASTSFLVLSEAHNALAEKAQFAMRPAVRPSLAGASPPLPALPRGPVLGRKGVGAHVEVASGCGRRSPPHTSPPRPGRLGPHCGRGSQVPHGGRGSQGRRRGRGGLASPLGPRFGSGVALRPSLPRAGPRPARRAPVGECGWMGGHENQGEAHPPSRAAPQSLSSSGDETAQPSAPAGGPCVSGSGTGTHGRQKAHRSPGGVGLNATRQNQCPERSLHTHHWRA